MVRIIALFFVGLVSGCGDVDNCDGVDTSQAPDSSYVNGNYITYNWGSCSRTYQYK